MNGTGDSLFDQHAKARSADGVHRIMLDWSQPLIENAARWLIENRNQSSNSTFSQHCVDLRDTMCVLPGSRAGRLLLEELLRQCEASDRSLLPPMMTTPGRAVDTLLEQVTAGDDTAADIPVADDWTVELAWMEALRQCDAELLRPLLSQLPELDNWPAWQRLARTMANLHETLAGARCAFADVAPRAEALEKFPEGDRWRALAQLFEQYESILAAHGCIDPQERREQSLRQFENKSESPGAMKVVLIGVVELNTLQRAAFTAAAAVGEVFAVVHAPQELADRFDELGCVRAGAWDDVIIYDSKTSVIVADRPMDQARRVIETIASFSGRYHADDVVIGLGDASLAGAIERSASWAGLKLHDAAGSPMSRSPVFRALQLCATWLQRERFADFAALVRHPHVERWLLQHSFVNNSNATIEQWATLLDEYYCEHLQGTFTGRWLGDRNKQKQLALVYDGVQALLAPLRGNGKTRPLREWAPAVGDVLHELPRDRSRNRDWEQMTRTQDAIDRIISVASELELSNAALQPSVDGATALRMILTRCDSDAIAEHVDESAIEMLGWLELHADPAAALIITGFNEGAIPSSISADIFLPNDLRACLGLPSNTSRYARDAYLIAAAQQTRESLTIIAGRRATNDEPLTPSRLLLQGDDALLLKRASLLCDEPGHAGAEIPIGLSQPPSSTLFVVPPLPAEMPAITSMRVTDFALYIRCPYRFALARLLRLEHRLDGALEIEPMQFGSLLHGALNYFGRDPSLRDLTDERTIFESTTEILFELARQQFGNHPLPSVRIQLAQMQQRLIGFAREQVKLRSDGWEIRHVEYDINRIVSLDIPGEDAMPLSGRIDRIDYNQQRNHWRVIDYKSSEEAKTPCQSHHSNRKTVPKDDELTWSDFQLPLYEYIIRRAGLGVDGTIDLCYLNLPGSSDDACIAKAPWEEHHLSNGIETARGIVRAIRRGEFDPNPEAGGKFDDFARLCHNEFLSAMGDEAPEEDE